MPRGKKIEFTLGKIWIEFSCSKCEKYHKVEIDEDSFDHWESPCELCGSHGGLSISVECPSCKHTRDIEIRSW